MKDKYTFYYPYNLNEEAWVLLWTTRNAIIAVISSIMSMFILFYTGFFIPLAATVLFAIATVRIGDITIYDYTKTLVKYIITDKLILKYDQGGKPTMPNKNTCDKELNISNIMDSHLQLYTQNDKQVYIFIKPVNVAVLPTEFMQAKIHSLVISIKAVEQNNVQIEPLCMNSSQSFEKNKEYLTRRIQEEKNIHIRKLLRKDLLELDEIKLKAAANREFIIALTFTHGESENTMNNIVSNIMSTLEEGGFSPSQATKNDYKRLVSLYYEQPINFDSFVEYDGEQYLGGESDNEEEFI